MEVPERLYQAYSFLSRSVNNPRFFSNYLNEVILLFND
jgi:hypothetical protein